MEVFGYEKEGKKRKGLRFKSRLIRSRKEAGRGERSNVKGGRSLGQAGVKVGGSSDVVF